MSLKSQAASGVRWTAASSAFSTGAQLVQVVVLAQLLAPQDFGLMAMVMVLIGFAGVFADAGVSAAIVHRQDATRRQLSSLYWLNVGASWLIFGLLWLVTPAAVLFFGEAELSALVPVVALGLPIGAVGRQFEILSQRALRFRRLAVVETAASLGGTIVAIAAALGGLGVWALVVGHLCRAGVKTSLLVKACWEAHRPDLHFSRRDLRGFMSFGLYQLGERNINYVAENLDQLLIGKLLGADALGYYSLAIRIAVLPIQRINPIVTKVAFPILARVQHEIARLRRGYLAAVNLVTATNAPLLVGLAVLAPSLVPVFFGPQWEPSIILIQILAFVSLGRSSGNPVGSLLLAKGRADLGFRWNLMLLLVSAPALYWAGRAAGAVGIAGALLAIQLVLRVPGYFYLIRPLLGRCGKGLLIAVGRPVVLGGLAGAVAWVSGFGGAGGWRGLLLQGAVVTIIYSVLSWWFQRSVVDEARELVRPLIHRRGDSSPLAG